MHDICGVPLIELLCNRLALSRNIDQLVLATSNNSDNISMVAHMRHRGFCVFQGSETDVLDRYY